MDIQNSHPDGQGLLMLAVCILLNFFAKFLEWVGPLLHSHIPPFIMDSFQVAAWCGAIGVFILQWKKRNKD